MRNLVIPALVFLPTLAGIAHAAQQQRAPSVALAGCDEAGRPGPALRGSR